MIFEPLGDATCVEVVLHVAGQRGHFGFLFELFAADNALVPLGELLRIKDVLREIRKHTFGPPFISLTVNFLFSVFLDNPWHEAD